jgi:hypothetical protein
MPSQNPNIQSSTAAIVTARTLPLLVLFCRFLSPVEKKLTSSKSKEILVDEEVSLSVIENQDFIAMRAAERSGHPHP